MDQQTPELSVVVVVFDIAAQAQRTLMSLSPGYQGLHSDRYELIVVDNASNVSLDQATLDAGGAGVRYVRIEPPASPSPAKAMNVGANLARGRLLGLVVDGARMASPGLLRAAMRAARLDHDPVISTLAWHLGPDVQARSSLAGWDRAAEDASLLSIGWPSDGYRLFEISTAAPASDDGYLLPLPESSAVFLPKTAFQALGGFDERFEQPGGGLVASDFFRRAIEREGAYPVMLIGEGTFHQVHGSGGSRYDTDALCAEYEWITGRPFAAPSYRPTLFGDPHPSTLPVLTRSAVLATRFARSAGVIRDTPTGFEQARSPTTT